MALFTMIMGNAFATFAVIMAANFNLVPATVLEIDDKNKLIKTQSPIALILLVIHIILMLIWAF